MAAFLDSHGFADEIVLVDGGSDDRTREIALAHPRVRWYERGWTTFPEQWNHGIERASGDWILISEADHRVSPALRDEIAAVVGGGRREDAFLIPRRNYIFGRWLRHGGCWPDYGYPRLLRRGAGRFDTDKRIHEKLRVSVAVGRLKGHFDHLSIATVDEYLAKMAAYTTEEARSFADRCERHGSRWRAAAALLADRKIPPRQRLSYLRPFIPGGPALSFLWRYAVRAGFLDGRAGLQFCLLSALYEFVWRAKAREIVRRG